MTRQDIQNDLLNLVELRGNSDDPRKRDFQASICLFRCSAPNAAAHQGIVDGSRRQAVLPNPQQRRNGLPPLFRSESRRFSGKECFPTVKALALCRGQQALPLYRVQQCADLVQFPAQSRQLASVLYAVEVTS